MGYATLGSKSIGSIVTINEAGSPVEFYVAEHDYESGLNGTGRTLLVRRYVYPTAMQWGTEYPTDSFGYPDYSVFYNSNLYGWLNKTYVNSLDAKIQSAIGTTYYKIGSASCGRTYNESTEVYYFLPYCDIVTSGSAVFSLSATELGFDWTPSEGTEIESASVLRVAYDSGGIARNQWARSIYYNGTGGYDYATYVTNKGKSGQISLKSSYYARPVFTLPDTTLVDENGNITTNTPPTTPSHISLPSSIMGGTAATVSWGVSSDAEDNLAGYKVDRSTDGGSSWSQIYQGTETSTTNNVAFGTSSVMYRVKAYDDEGLESDYKTSAQVTVVNNNAPTAPLSITVPTSVKGGDTLTISWTAASDSDGNLAGYVLERSTDGGDSYTQVYKGNALTYTDSITKGWMTVTYRVKAYDSYNAESGYVTSSSRTVDNNTAPTITTSSAADLGTKTSGFTVSYSVDDVDSADTLTVTEKLDNVVKRTYTPTRKATNSFAVTGEYFQKILNGKHTLTISVTDGKETTTKTISFTKLVTSVNVTLSQPMDADAQITLCAVTVSGNIPNDAALKVEVTNNAKDSSPVWEDCTVESQNNRNHVFTNETAANGWSFNFRVAVERGTSSGGYITSIQGGFQ